MQYSTNYNLKKPDYTDFADIQDINDNTDTIDAQLAAPTGDSADSTTTFTTSDTADGSASSWTNVPALTSGETHKSLFAKMSQMFKNIRYLYKLLGTTDISAIGNGTVTNALSVLNANIGGAKFFAGLIELNGTSAVGVPFNGSNINAESNPGYFFIAIKPTNSSEHTFAAFVRITKFNGNYQCDIDVVTNQSNAVMQMRTTTQTLIFNLASNSYVGNAPMFIVKFQ